MMACVMAAGRIDLPEEMTPTSRLCGFALVERLHELAREAPPADLESVLRALPAAQWAKLEGASRSWRLAAGAGSTRWLVRVPRRSPAWSATASPANEP